MRDDWDLATRLVHEGAARSQFGETCEPLFLTQGFVYGSAEEAAARFAGDAEGFVYSRYGNPTVAMFEERMAVLEGAEAARGTASGMAAVTAALMAAVKAGDHVLASGALFGGCRYVVETYLPRFGVETTLIDGTDLDAWRAAVRPNTRVFFLETPTNPTLSLVDLEGVARIRDEAAPEALMVVDNVFATPLWQRPLQFGADIIIYSATKHVDGQGRCLGGVILARKKWIEDNLDVILKQTGPALSPFNAWVLLKSLETLPLRVRAQTDNAEQVADALAAHDKVTRVIYPGRADHPQAELAARQMVRGGTLVSFSVAGGKEAAFAVANGLGLIKLSNNLGDAKSLLTHPATTTHKNLSQDARDALGIDDGLLRLSLGVEAADDLIADLTQSLDKAHGATKLRTV
ncbi:MAG: O-succinylhomoserine sulfhydrylase [Pseudomonadota bacterium]